jgi:glycosyltransferase involved in cell wall biosynthesis
MKVAVVNNQAPFVRGGAELLAEWLRDKLREYGHEAEVVRIPFKWSPATKIVDHMLAARLVRLAGADRVVALKFPAYFVPHENKVLWLLHQFRQAYELWGTPYQDIPNSPIGHRVRESIIRADRSFLSEAKRIYTNSEIVGHRLRMYTGIESEILYPPLLDPESLQCEDYGDYFFCPGRITAGKRQHLAVAAMADVAGPSRLIIAGQPETTGDLERLTGLIRELKLERRIEVIPRWISEEEKIRLMTNARGVVYLPFGEDSYGYVTLEAFHAHKAVITLADSGGILELVRDRHNGLVPSDVAGLSRALQELADDRDLAENMGGAAFSTLEELDISWDRVIGELTR